MKYAIDEANCTGILALAKQAKKWQGIPDKLSFREPFGTYSYISICSPRSKQNP